MELENAEFNTFCDGMGNNITIVIPIGTMCRIVDAFNTERETLKELENIKPCWDYLNALKIKKDEKK